MNNLGQYIKNSFLELRDKVTWLSWSDLQSSSITVIVGVIILAFLLAIIDFFISQGLTGVFNFLS